MHKSTDVIVHFTYINHVSPSPAMHESSKNVQACLADMYEPDWYGKNEVDSIVEVRYTFIRVQVWRQHCSNQ